MLDMSNMREILDGKLARLEELDRQLADPEVLSSAHKMAVVARERGMLDKIVSKYRRFKDLNQQIADAVEISDSGEAELRQMAEAELPTLRQEREKYYDELLDLTVGDEDIHRTRCVMEIRAGTGGDEAALFARDLYEMYRRYSEAKGWRVEILDMNATELGGFKSLTLGIDGDGVFRELRFESGVHRVQRVPETEAQGRVHTSTATVAVLAEPEDVEIDIKPEDYRLDLVCAGGPGGQHVNKTASAVRLTHYESGIVVSCQDEKSQHKNKAKALRVLKSRLYEHKRATEHAKRAQARKSMIGGGERSEKIRTYNFPDNRVTDHRIKFTLHKLDAIMAGDVSPMINAVLDVERQEQRGQMGSFE